MIKGKTVGVVFLSLFIALVVFVLVFWLTFVIAIELAPPVFIDSDGEEHVVMAMGQFFLAMILAIVSSIFSLVICYRKLWQGGEEHENN